MKKIIEFKLVDLTEEEWAYYNELIKLFGVDIFSNTFTSNKEGYIQSVLPPLDRPTPMPVIFFLFNLMLNQRMRDIDDFLVKNKK